MCGNFAVGPPKILFASVLPNMFSQFDIYKLEIYLIICICMSHGTHPPTSTNAQKLLLNKQTP